MAYLDVAHINIFDQPASARIGLNADHTVQVGAVHRAIFHKQMLVPASDFTANDHSPVAIFHVTTADDDVFAGHFPFSTIVVTTRLDGNAIITRIKETILDQHVAARFGITAVAVGTIVNDGHTLDNHVFTQQGMNDPKSGIQQRDAFDQDTV